MTSRRFLIALAPLVAVAAVVLTAIDAPAQAGDGGIAARSYVQSNLVSDIPGLAMHTDPNLRNPWGTSVGPGSPIWVSDNAAGVTTLYDGAGNARSVVVTVPAPPSAGVVKIRVEMLRGGEELLRVQPCPRIPCPPGGLAYRRSWRSPPASDRRDESHTPDRRSPGISLR